MKFTHHMKSMLEYWLKTQIAPAYLNVPLPIEIGKIQDQIEAELRREFLRTFSECPDLANDILVHANFKPEVHILQCVLYSRTNPSSPLLDKEYFHLKQLRAEAEEAWDQWMKRNVHWDRPDEAFIAGYLAGHAKAID